MEDVAWRPDRSSSVPLHTQVEEYIRTKISKGEWTVGTRLPSQRALAHMIGVNRSTVVTAFEELIAQGLIEGKKGGGTRVVNTTWSLLASHNPPDWNTYVQSGAYQPNLPLIQDIHEAEARTDGIIRLGTGELSPELLPYAKTEQLFTKLVNRKAPLGYEVPKGNRYLREQLALYLKRLGIDCSPASILIVSGALQALQLISIGLLKAHSAILLEKASYLHSLKVFQSSRIQLHGIPTDDEGLQVSLLSKYKRACDATLLYTNPSFHNPTGSVMSEERRKLLLSICEKERLPIIEDDVYRELWFDTPPPLPLKARDKNGMVLYLGSMSKTVSPGLRIGWVVGPEPVIERLADIKMQTDYGSSTFSQWVTAEWMESGLFEVHLQFIRQELKIRRDALVKLLEKHLIQLASWKIPKGGFYIWLQLHAPINVREVFNQALAEGILLNPGSLYDREATRFLRLSFSYASIDEMEEGIARLARIIKRQFTLT